MSNFDASSWIRAATVAELESRKVMQVKGRNASLAVFWFAGEAFAVDNRCPHMGYPLHRGTVKDGVLTCHWHHANYDLCSGCSFSMFADDAPAYDTHIKDGVVYVAPEPRRKFDKSDHASRLQRGLDQNVAIVIARSVDLLHQADPTAQSVIREVARYGSERLNFFSGGMTALSIAANLLPYLGPQTAFFTTYKAAKLVAANAFGRAPRMLSEPLDTDEHSSEALLRWLRRWAENGQVTGGERVILTISRTKASTQEISAMFFEAATDRMFASDGQAVYMPNSGFELIEFLGRDTAEHILPLLVRWISNRGAGAEDKNPWNNPVDVIAPLRHAEKQIPAWIEAGKGKTFSGEEQLKTVLLGDDPYAIIEALGGALQEGSTPTNLAKIVAYAAARRLAHFSLKNELQDWSSPARTFSYCNAMHRIIKRSPEDALLVRGIFHGAIAVYMDRFLNVPSAPLPGARQKLDDLPTEADGLCLGLLNALDEQANVEATARYVARYSALGLDMKALFNTLMLATMREDLGLQHWLVLSAGVTQALEWQGRPEAGHILVAVARHLAAFCPTPRSEITAAKVASRLNRGERLYEAQPAH